MLSLSLLSVSLAKLTKTIFFAEWLTTILFVFFTGK
jgi:hypothetical protein